MEKRPRTADHRRPTLRELQFSQKFCCFQVFLNFVTWDFILDFFNWFFKFVSRT